MVTSAAPVTGIQPPAGFQLETPLAPQVQAPAPQPSGIKPPPGFRLEQSVQQQTQADPVSGPEHFLETTLPKGLAEAGGDVWGAIKSAATTIFPGQGELVEGIKEAIPSFHAYETARASGKGIVESISAANEEAKKQIQARDVLKQRIDEFKANPGIESVRAVGDAAAFAASMYAGGEMGAATEEGAVEGAEGASEATAPTQPAQPGIVKQILKGKDVAQPQAQTAIKQAVGGATEADTEGQELLSGNKTIVDDHLDNLRTKEKTAYRKVDDTVGFDLKAEKQQLANDQYKLKQLGNTDADMTQRGNLIESINDSTDRIAEAEQKLKDAGIDPAEADTIHKSRMAGNDFKKALIKNVSSDGQSVNIDGMLNSAKALRFSKYGDRLEQFFGSHESAEEFMNQLESAQKLGVHAMKIQRVAKWIGSVAGASTLIGGLGHAASIAGGQ